MAKPIPKELQQKIAQSQLGSGPSLVPSKMSRPGEIVEDFLPEEAIPTVEELIGEAEDLDTLKLLVNSLLIPQAEVKRLEKVIDTIKPRIKVIVGQYGIAKARCGEAVLSYFPTSRSTVNAKKLLAAGVDEATITACTDVSHSFTLKVSEK